MLKKPIKILLVEDNLAEVSLLEKFLVEDESSQIRLVQAKCLSEALQILNKDNFDLVLLDLILPDTQGLESLTTLIHAAPHLGIIVLINMNDDDSLAREAILKGAQDYLVKELVNQEILNRSVNYAIEHQQIQEELQTAKQELAQTNQLLQQEILERQKIEEQLKNAQVELEQFTYLVSHDLNQPLSTIYCWTQMLQMRYSSQLDAKAKKYITSILNGTKQMNQLIQDLLTYSRVGTTKQVFELTECERVLKLVKARLEKAISESNAIITHDSLPTVTADLEQLNQLFHNLLANALQYHSEESPQIHISAKLREIEQNNHSKEWLFSCQDNGIGIESKYFERIFQIFQRLHSQEHSSGTGIGLAICKKIVKRHGGSLWVESQLGRGTTFYFTIPEVHLR